MGEWGSGWERFILLAPSHVYLAKWADAQLAVLWDFHCYVSKRGGTGCLQSETYKQPGAQKGRDRPSDRETQQQNNGRHKSYNRLQAPHKSHKGGRGRTVGRVSVSHSLAGLAWLVNGNRSLLVTVTATIRNCYSSSCYGNGGQCMQ